MEGSTLMQKSSIPRSRTKKTTRALPRRTFRPKVMAPRSKAASTKVIESEVTDGDVEKLVKAYPGFIFRRPAGGETYLSYKEGELCLFLRHLKDGLELPLPGYLKSFLNHYKMVPAQFTPNTLVNLRGLSKFFESVQVKWTVANVMSLLTITSTEDGIYYSQVRHVGQFSLSGTPTAVHRWKNKYVFVSSKEPWGISTIPRTVNISIFKGLETTAAIEQMYKDLDCVHLDLNVKTLAVDTSGKSKATKGEKEEVAPKRKADGGRGDGSEDAPGEKKAVTPQKKRRMPAGRAQKKKVEEPEEDSSSSEEENEDEDDAEGETGSEEGGESDSGEEGEGDDEESEALVNEVDPGKEAVKAGPSSLPRCWWNNEEAVCSFRYNKDHQMIPEIDTFEVPSQILAALFSPKDKDYLGSLSAQDLMRLQCQLSFGGAMVARYISDLAKVKDSEGQKEKQSLEGSLEEVKKEKTDAEKKLEELKTDSTNQKNGFLIEIRGLTEEIEKLKAGKTADRAEKEKLEGKIKALEKQVTEEKKAAKRSTDEHHKYNEELKKQIEDLKAAAPSSSTGPSISVAEAKAAYEGTTEYLEDMGEYGSFGFDLLKAALEKDGVVSKTVLEGYDYLDCMDRASSKQL